MDAKYFSHDEVPDMDWVERATEYADARVLQESCPFRKRCGNSMSRMLGFLAPPDNRC